MTGRLIHASCVAYQGRGALITGVSGSGKSSLALDLIALGAVLVADDQVEVTVSGDGMHATAPAPVRGLIEVRGAGLLRVRTAKQAKLVLAVDLDAEAGTRLPQLRQFRITDAWLPLIAGKNLPHLGSLVMAGLRYGTQPIFEDPDA